MKADLQTFERARAWVHQQSGRGLDIWAVVDACGCIKTTHRLETLGGSDCVNLFDGDGLDAAATSAGPRLSLLTHARIEEAACEAFAGQARDTPSIFFIATSWRRDALVQSLRRRVDVYMASGEDSLMLRWWDPRIWSALRDVLDEEANMQFFSPIASDFFLDRSGGIRTHAEIQPQTDFLTDRLHVSDSVEQALMEAGEPDAIMNIMRELYGLESLDPIPGNLRYAWCASQIRLAREHQIESPVEQAFACRIASHKGAGWWDSSYGRSLLQLRSKKHLSLIDAALAAEEQAQ